MSNRTILLAILAFVVLTFGSFIYFVATWDASKEPQLSFIIETLFPPGPQIIGNNLTPDFYAKIAPALTTRFTI